MRSDQFGVALSVITTTTRSVPEHLLPVPAMGNMKPGTAEYAAKYNEKMAKITEEAKDHPLFGSVVEVAVALFDEVNPVERTYRAHEVTRLNFAGFLAWAERIRYKIDFVVGPHPTTDCRLLLNNCLAEGVSVVPWLLLPEVPKINPWQCVCPPSEGEYPLVAQALNIYSGDPLLDSAVLAARLSLI